MSLGSHRGVGLNDISGGCRVRLWAEGCRPHCIEPTTILLPIENMYEHDDHVYNMFQKEARTSLVNVISCHLLPDVISCIR